MPYFGGRKREVLDGIESISSGFPPFYPVLNHLAMEPISFYYISFNHSK